MVDIAFPKQKVAIEVDGWAFHSDQEVFQNDRKRQNAIALKRLAGAAIHVAGSDGAPAARDR